MSGGMLAGIRIVDLTTVVMGPWATHLLADYGADVVKVEAPEGDIMRAASAARNPGMGALFLHGNRGKRSIVLDLKRPQGRDALLRICERADVFVHNIRRSAMERLDLAYPAFAARNPRLIHVSLAGFSGAGPYADLPAYDDLIQGASGLAALFERAGAGEPRYVPALIADRIGGMTAANAILAALLARERTGLGGPVEVPMFETLVELVLSDHLGGATFEPPLGPVGYARALAPNRRPYPTTDGYLCLLLYTEAHWERFFAVVGRSEAYRADPRLSDPRERAAHYDEAYGAVAAIVAGRSTATWLAALREADLPVMPLGDIATLSDDPHLLATGFVAIESHPTEGPIRALGVPVRHEQFPRPEHRPAPRLGEHSREVLRGAGYDEAEINRLVADGVTLEAATLGKRTVLRDNVGGQPMKHDQSSGAAPSNPSTTGVMDDVDGTKKPAEQPTTIAGGVVGPLEIAIEQSDTAPKTDSK